jgi:hypothetical protein
MNGAPPRIVVFAPDLVLAALFDPTARQVLEAWRDGRIKPVIDRELLLAYLKMLRKAGLTSELLRHWAAWFTNKEASIYIESDENSQTGIIARCDTIASLGSAAEIICFRIPQRPNPGLVTWKTAEQWAAKMM